MVNGGATKKPHLKVSLPFYVVYAMNVFQNLPNCLESVSNDYEKDLTPVQSLFCFRR